MNFFNLKPEQKNILQAARSNNVAYIRQMHKGHFANEFNFKDENGNTPLYIAVVNRQVDAVRELIKIGADVNAKCENGNTCLHRMMLFKDGDPRNELIINILLNNGQVNKRRFSIHKQYHDMTGKEYELLATKNTTNLRNLNDMNKTALYYAS